MRTTDLGRRTGRAPAHLAATWFAGLLRDGFALTTVGASESFAQIGAESTRVPDDIVAVHPWDIDGASRAGARHGVGEPVGRALPGVLRSPRPSGGVPDRPC